MAGLPCPGRGARGRRVRTLSPVCAGLLALAVPLATAGVAAAATLSSGPLPSASVNGRVRQVAYSGTTLYLVGDFTQATDGGTTYTRNHAAAIDTTTGHLLPWDPEANGSIYTLAVDATNNAVYLGGTFTNVGGVSEAKLAQVSADTGAVNGSWKNKVSGAVYSLSLGNGMLYVGGRITKIDNVARANAGAIDLSTSTLDPSWQPDVEGGPIYSLATDAANSRVYIGSNATSVDGSTQESKLAAVDQVAGALDPTFTLSGYGIPWEVFDIDVTPTAVYAAVGGPGGWLWSLTPSGDANWIDTVDGNILTVTDVDGLIVAGGHFNYFCSSPYLGYHGTCSGPDWTRKKLFAVDTNGVLQDWAPNGNSALGVWTARSDAAGDQIAVGGDFTQFKNPPASQPHLALFGVS